MRSNPSSPAPARATPRTPHCSSSPTTTQPPANSPAPQLADGTPLSTDELVKLAVDAKILPALFDTAGQPLWLGREYRDANTAQRIALTARDRRCVACKAPNSFCQPHHIIFWENGGTTDLDNLCLLCGDCHHKQVHKRGARIVTGPDGKYTLQHPRTRRPAGPKRRSTCDGRGAADANSGGTGTVSYPLLR